MSIVTSICIGGPNNGFPVTHRSDAKGLILPTGDFRVAEGLRWLICRLRGRPTVTHVRVIYDICPYGPVYQGEV